jgi:hypothetical protein
LKGRESISFTMDHGLFRRMHFMHTWMRDASHRFVLNISSGRTMAAMNGATLIISDNLLAS